MSVENRLNTNVATFLLILAADVDVTVLVRRGWLARKQGIRTLTDGMEIKINTNNNGSCP
jgi:hypothetical protein